MLIDSQSLSFCDAWIRLRSVATRLLTVHSVSQREWEDSFADVYILCTKKDPGQPDSYAKMFYSKLSTLIFVHVKRIKEGICANTDYSDFLAEYAKQFCLFNEGSTVLNKLTKYLNAHYVKRNRPSYADIFFNFGDEKEFLNFSDDDHIFEIKEVCIKAWLDMVKSMSPSLSSAISELILHCRQDSVDCDSSFEQRSVLQRFVQRFLRTTLQSFKTLSSISFIKTPDLYGTIFEDPFRLSTVNYFTEWREKNLCSLEAKNFVEKALSLRSCELQRAGEAYLQSEALIKELFVEMVIKQSIVQLTNYIRTSVQAESIADLCQIYKYLQCSGSHAVLCDEINSYVTACMRKYLKEVLDLPQCTTSKAFCLKVIEKRKHFFSIFADYFVDDDLSLFRQTIDKAISSAIGQSCNSAAETCCSNSVGSHSLAKMLSVYIEEHMLSVLPFNSDDLWNELLDGISILFRYVENKDLFQRYYQASLVRRLLNYPSDCNVQFELRVIERIKQDSGSLFTSNLSKLCNDIVISSEISRSFSFSDRYLNSCRERTGQSAFSFKLLSAVNWPINLDDETKHHRVKLCAPIQNVLSSFHDYYIDRYSGRKITWLHSHSKATVVFRFSTKPYYVEMNLLHLSILKLFDENDSDVITEEQAFQVLNCVDEQVATRIVDFLCTPKAVLNKEGRTYRLNRNFNNPEVTFRIASEDCKTHSAASLEETPERLAEADRKMFISASSVRILKAQRKLSHHELFRQLFELARPKFRLSSTLMSAVIDGLADKGYISVVTDDEKTEYIYLA